jgi:hypothetical protein
LRQRSQPLHLEAAVRSAVRERLPGRNTAAVGNLSLGIISWMLIGLGNVTTCKREPVQHLHQVILKQEKFRHRETGTNGQAP